MVSVSVVVCAMLQKYRQLGAKVNIFGISRYVLISCTCDMTEQIVQPYELDRIDERLIAALASFPRAGMLQLAREVGVARNTAQARFDRLSAPG